MLIQILIKFTKSLFTGKLYYSNKKENDKKGDTFKASPFDKYFDVKA
jgi:hypothetical protein